MENNKKIALTAILNRLNAPMVRVNDLLGIYTILVLSKQIFKSNKDLKEFLEQILNIEIADWAAKTRSSMLPKATKHIFLLDSTTAKELQKATIKELSYLLEIEIKNSDNIKEVIKKSNQTSTLEMWLSGIK